MRVLDARRAAARARELNIHQDGQIRAFPSRPTGRPCGHVMLTMRERLRRMQDAMPHLRIKRAARGALSATALVAVAVGAVAVTAPAQPSHAAGATLAAEDARVPAGKVLVVRGRGFPHDAHVALRAGRAGGETARIGGAHTGRRGSFVAEIRIDPDAPAGRYVAVACHDHCRVKAAVPFRVQRP